MWFLSFHLQYFQNLRILGEKLRTHAHRIIRFRRTKLFIRLVISLTKLLNFAKVALNS
jgi:hypothetical protein